VRAEYYPMIYSSNSSFIYIDAACSQKATKSWHGETAAQTDRIKSPPFFSDFFFFIIIYVYCETQTHKKTKEIKKFRFIKFVFIA